MPREHARRWRARASIWNPTRTTDVNYTPKFGEMAPPSGLLFFALNANVAYFVAMSVAHWIGYKVPVLFIYYDTPFHAYQDKIIAFCAATYAIFCFAASRHRAVVPFVIASLAVTTAGLSAINASDELRSVLPKGASTNAYWAQTGMIGALTVAIALLYSASPDVKEKVKSGA